MVRVQAATIIPFLGSSTQHTWNSTQWNCFVTEYIPNSPKWNEHKELIVS